MPADTKHWTQALESADLDEGAHWPVVVEGRSICLYRAAGAVYATDDVCSHGHANLSDGYLEGYEIECPFHQGRFDIRTGAVLDWANFPPGIQLLNVVRGEKALQTYKVSVKSGQVRVSVPEA